MSIESLAMIGYCCNHLGGQLNYYASAHWLISRATNYQFVIGNLWHGALLSHFKSIICPLSLLLGTY